MFSPLVLRVSGALLVAVAPWAIAEAPRTPRTWSDAVTLTTMAVACWVLAARRTPKDPAELATLGSGARPFD